MRSIPLTKGVSAIVDDEDYEKLVKYSWCYHGDGYAARGYNRNGKVIIVKMHHAVIGKPAAGYVVDHINGNRLDNRKCNLRFVTVQQNCFNSKKKKSPVGAANPSPYKGVTWRNDRSKWRSCITVDGQRVYLGLFETALEAALAYNRAAVKYHGEYTVSMREGNTVLMRVMWRTGSEVDRMQNRKNEVENIVITNGSLVPICEKYTLTIKEAAAYFNIGIKKMRRMAEENTGRFSVFCGNKYLVIRPKFEKFIDDSSEI